MKVIKKEEAPAIQEKKADPVIQEEEPLTLQEELERLKHSLLIIQNQHIAIWSIKESLELMNKRLKDMIEIYALVNKIELDKDD